MALYLADSSIWAGRRRPDSGDLPRLFLDRLRRGEIATCVPVALEVLSAASDGEKYVRDWMTIWSRLHWLPLRDRATGRALEVQSALALAGEDGQHKSVAHFLIAACAEDAGPEVVLWHWDEDLAEICEHTGQQHEFEETRAARALALGLDGNGADSGAVTRRRGPSGRA